MADPISAIGCVLGILSSLITLSQPVIKLVDDVKNASSEIQHLSKDIHALFSVVRFLDHAVREREVRDIVESEDAISYQIRSLEYPLRNCRDVLMSLMVKYEALGKKGVLIGFRKLRWAVFTKNEARSILIRLETMKATLNCALNAVTM